MDNHHAEALGAVFVSEVYRAGDVIVPQGRPWGYVRVVAEGDVEVRSVGGTATTIKFGGSIGEVSILEPNSIAQATVRAGCDGAVMLRASRTEILDYLATFPDDVRADHVRHVRLPRMGRREAENDFGRGIGRRLGLANPPVCDKNKNYA